MVISVNQFLFSVRFRGTFFKILCCKERFDLMFQLVFFCLLASGRICFDEDENVGLFMLIFFDASWLHHRDESKVT